MKYTPLVYNMSRRWEAPSSTGGKFWEVEQDGCNVTTKWGRLTATGQSKTAVFETEEKATKFVETTIKKKEKEGYTLKASVKTVAKAATRQSKTAEKAPAAKAKKALPKDLTELLPEEFDESSLPTQEEKIIKMLKTARGPIPGKDLAQVRELCKKKNVDIQAYATLKELGCALEEIDPRPEKWTKPAGPDSGQKPEDPKYWNGVMPPLKKYFPKSFHCEEGKLAVKIQKYIAANFVERQKWSEIEKELKKNPPKEDTKSKGQPVKKVVVEEEPEAEEPEEEEDGAVPTSYVLPPLYNIDTKGKERVHLSWVKGNTLTKKHGETNGKHTLADRSFEGKNVGRSNETDANEQACREAERDWVKQVNKGYKPKTTDKKGYAIYKKVIAEKAKQGGVNTNAWMILARDFRGVDVSTLAPKPKSASAAKTAAEKAKKKANNGTLPNYVSDLFPMGCQKLVPPNREPSDIEEKVLKYLNFGKGVYIQRKLDGIRCVVRIVKRDGKKYVVFTSRANNQFVYLMELRGEVLKFLEGHEDVVLDCEVYQHQIRASATYKKVGGKNKVVFGKGDEIIPRIMNFKAITSAVRSSMTNPSPLEDQLCLYVFDIIDPTETLTQDERFKKLDALFARKGIAEKCPKIIKVERFTIHSPDEIPVYQEKFFNEGYEGVVLRDRSLKYECLKKNKRSKWMRKYKYFFDAEFEIIGVDRDKGVPREQFSWLCRTEDGEEFKAKPEGTREMKWEWYDNRDEIIGKMLIVRYQDLEDSGKPRFPIAIEIRDFE